MAPQRPRPQQSRKPKKEESSLSEWVPSSETVLRDPEFFAGATLFVGATGMVAFNEIQKMDTTQIGNVVGDMGDAATNVLGKIGDVALDGVNSGIDAFQSLPAGAQCLLMVVALSTACVALIALCQNDKKETLTQERSEAPHPVGKPQGWMHSNSPVVQAQPTYSDPTPGR